MFKGTDPSGDWRLYVNDDASSDWGSIMSFCLDVYPIYPAAEVTNVRWRPGFKNTLEWDAAANAVGYDVLRGTRDQLPGLLSNAEDSCQAAGEHRQFADYLSTDPPPGTLFWYLVVGVSSGQRGPSGAVRVGGIEAARTADALGGCPGS